MMMSRTDVSVGEGFPMGGCGGVKSRAICKNVLVLIVTAIAEHAV